MLKFAQACFLAHDFINANMNVQKLLTATEDDNYWYFSGGDPEKTIIGNTIISVDKATGIIDIVDYLSDEGYEAIRKSTPIELPEEYIEN